MRPTALLAIGATLAACTFPDVDYLDGAAATCPAPASCEGSASKCADSANEEHDMCSQQCKPNKPACPGQCDEEWRSALEACAAECASCAEDKCGSEPTNCSALVGL